MKKQITTVSLYAGAGGLDLGFEQVGFKTIWANDSDKDACATHSAWSDAEVCHAKIEKVNFDTVPIADVILGGFPCQGFSFAGPRKLDDKRNVLYKYFVKLVEKQRNRAFVAENVKGILSMGDDVNGYVIDAIKRDFADLGYRLYVQLLNASDYGVPQDRERVIIVGLRDDVAGEYIFPQKTTERINIQKALQSIPYVKSELCNDSFSPRFMSRNRRRDWEDVSFTIPATAKQVPLHPSSPDMMKLGKDLWAFGDGGVTRRLSWREAAAIQTFPADMPFQGDTNSIYKQVGNAVPPKLAEVIARPLYELLK